MAEALLNKKRGSDAEGGMEAEITLPDKIFHLKGIQIFEDLTVRELAAIASVTEEVVHSPGEVVIEEGSTGDTMYLVVKGEVSVLKGRGEETTIELDRIGEGDYFGEMALFEDTLRSATIRTEKETRLLVLHKREFTEIVREYPEIALHICRALGSRIRKLHEKIRRYEK
jgi:CRP-like cAMP-binding protein